jgi:hypothetical protein
MAGGTVVLAVPVAAWWYRAVSDRRQKWEEHERKVEAAGARPYRASSDAYDYLIENRCRAGDVVLFDRRCHRCAASPWAALSCYAAKRLLDRDGDAPYDHVGVLVPGDGAPPPGGEKGEKKDPSSFGGGPPPPEHNLLLLEATPSGIVARPLKERLELSSSREVALLQLCSPGEDRSVGAQQQKDGGGGGDVVVKTSRQLQVERTRQHVERELIRFRDQWLEAGRRQHYEWMHSTLTLGGAVLLYAAGLSRFLAGPVSPAAYFVSEALQKAAAAPALPVKEQYQIQPAHFLNDYRWQEQNSVRLRPGWRFLAPIPIKESGTRT